MSSIAEICELNHVKSLEELKKMFDSSTGYDPGICIGYLENNRGDMHPLSLYEETQYLDEGETIERSDGTMSSYDEFLVLSNMTKTISRVPILDKNRRDLMVMYE